MNQKPEDPKDSSTIIKNSLKEAKDFEVRARPIVERYFNVQLFERAVKISENFTKKFDLVSEDEEWIGDMKYYRMIPTPAAKYSTIAEYVWLLQRTKAKHKFIVFGNSEELPKKWYNKHHELLDDVEFWFIDSKNAMKRISDTVD